jgi:hypothetical protein
MARPRKADTVEAHDLGSLNRVLQRIEMIQAQIIAVRDGMAASGPDQVPVPCQPSLTAGLTGLGTWSTELWKAWSTDDNSLRAINKNRISDVSD